MWPFRRRTRVDLTNEAFARWLRAQRPPLDWFLGRDEMVQEAMARIGDDYVASFAGLAEMPEAQEPAQDSLQAAQAEAVARMSRDRPDPGQALLERLRAGQEKAKPRFLGRTPDREAATP